MAASFTFGPARARPREREGEREGETGYAYGVGSNYGSGYGSGSSSSYGSSYGSGYGSMSNPQPLYGTRDADARAQQIWERLAKDGFSSELAYAWQDLVHVWRRIQPDVLRKLQEDKAEEAARYMETMFGRMHQALSHPRWPALATGEEITARALRARLAEDVNRTRDFLYALAGGNVSFYNAIPPPPAFPTLVTPENANAEAGDAANRAEKMGGRAAVRRLPRADPAWSLRAHRYRTTVQPATRRAALRRAARAMARVKRETVKGKAMSVSLSKAWTRIARRLLLIANYQRRSRPRTAAVLDADSQYAFRQAMRGAK
jgi:hypothetical protein